MDTRGFEANTTRSAIPINFSAEKSRFVNANLSLHRVLSKVVSLAGAPLLARYGYFSTGLKSRSSQPSSRLALFHRSEN